METTKFTKTEFANEKVISSIRFMASVVEDPSSIIESACRSYALTPEFINEFKEYITPDMVMYSPRLTVKFTEEFPEYFDYDKFREYVIEAFNKPDEDDPLVENGEEKAPKQYLNVDKLSLSMIIKLREDSEISQHITPDMIIDAVYDTDKDTLNNEDMILSLIGIDAKLDEVLLKSITDQDIKNAILLAISISDDRVQNGVTSTIYSYLGNDTKESMLGTSDVDPKEFIRALAESKDLGWKKEMIEKALSGKIDLRMTTDSFENDLIKLFTFLPEDLVSKVLMLRDKMPNALSYKVMSWVIEYKDFSEADYISALDAFKKSGLIFEIMKIAKQNNYTKLQEAISGK